MVGAVLSDVVWVVGGDVVERLLGAFREAMNAEVYEVPNVDDPARVFANLADRFWARIAFPLVEVSERVFRRIGDGEFVERVKSLERGLAKFVASVIRSSGYAHSEDLVRGFSALVDYDLWVLNRVAALGLDGFVRRLEERAFVEAANLVGYVMFLGFAWVAAASAVLGLVRGFREVNRDVLAAWCGEYAGLVDEYIDTVDVLLDDEAYAELRDLSIVGKGGL